MDYFKQTPFALERYFAVYEFSAPHLLCCSDCEPLTLKQALAMADQECTELWENLSLGYTESQGHPLLRSEVASLYPGIEPGGVLIGAPQELLFLGISALVEHGDHVVCTWPGYQTLYDPAIALGAEVSKLDVTELAGNGGTRALTDEVERLLRPTTKVVVINAPHNPTGWVPTAEEHAALAKLLHDRGIRLFSDEMYAGLEYDSTDSLPSAASVNATAVSVSGVSKSFGMPGVRIGWLICQDMTLIEKIQTLKDYTTICPSAPSEILALIALRNRDRLLEANLGLLRKNLSLLDDFFAKHHDRFNWTRPKAGSMCFPTVKGLREGASVETMCQELVDSKGVMLLPGAVYGFTDASRPDTQRFRLGFGRTNLPECLAIFEEFVRSQPDSFA